MVAYGKINTRLSPTVSRQAFIMMKADYVLMGTGRQVAIVIDVSTRDELTDLRKAS